MSERPFRFVHASDLHLEQPLRGVAVVPDHLRESFADAAYLAAKNVFDTVLAEEAAFLLLAGDVLDPHRAGARGLSLLLEQFDRLAERSIGVYWAGGRADPPDRWPTAVPLPRQVHIFAQGMPEEVTHHRDGEPLATILGSSYADRRNAPVRDFRGGSAGRFTVAVAFGHANPERLAKSHVDYWALGGRHARSMLLAAAPAAHYPGSPQGRSPAELGPHGCTVVHVDEDHEIRTQAVETDVLRWHNERIQLEPGATGTDLERLLYERIEELVESNSGRHLLIRWRIAADPQLAARLRRDRLAKELTDRLRSEFGHRAPAAWTISLEAQSPAKLPAQWYEEKTILGDFLRAARYYQTEHDEPLDLEPFLSASEAADDLDSVADLTAPTTRRRVLKEVSVLGADLLGGHDARGPLETDTPPAARLEETTT